MGEQAPFALLIASATDGRTLYVNAQFTRLTDYPAADAVTQLLTRPHGWLQLLNLADEERLLARLTDAALVLDEEVHCTPNAVAQRWFSLRCWPVDVPADSQHYRVITIEEITDRKRFEASLRADHTAQLAFHERLACMSRVLLDLTRANSLDELCHNAVAWGIRDLGFDRLGLWLLSSEPGMIRGTYGTDEAGQVRDERSYHIPIVQNDLLVHFLQQPEQRYAYFLGTMIRDVNLQPVGEGWHVVTGLWDGESIVGYFFADNLLRQLPYTEQEGELLSLYATTLGHLCTHLRIGEKVASRQRAADVFLGKMAALSKVAAQLTLSTNLEELCRSAVVLGRSELGFDRLGLWFTDEARNAIVSTFGTDEAGNLRNEWGTVKSLEEDFPLVQALKRKERYACKQNVIITSFDGQPLKFGWQAAAALWNGEQIIGYLFNDNLLRQQPYTEDDGELLALYALLLGHLCTRQRIEEDLYEREASYRTLINAIPDYMFVLTRDGVVLDAHEAHQPIPMLQLEHFIGKSIDALLPAEIASLFRLAIHDAFHSQRIASFEYLVPIQKVLYHFEARVTAGDHKVVVMVRDVTDRKRLEEQLYAAQKMESLGRMASGIAHDFNNLLTVIQGFTSVAEGQVPNNALRLHKTLGHIRSATEKGARLTSQLLLFARKQPVRNRVINVNELLLGAKTLLRTTLGEAVHLLLTLEPDLHLVEIDPGQFEQVLINLAVNARDAMPTGGTLAISTQNVEIDEPASRLQLNTPPGTYVMVELSDTGMGIEPELQQKIFEPFFTTKGSGKGTGLGLSICLSIIQQFGGQMGVYSIAGEGATFQILLPQTLKPLTPGEPVITQRPTTGAETILLVEDDDAVRSVAVEVLSSQGYQVLECASGVAALELARNYANTIHLLITDMIMPYMSGTEVTEHFRQLRPTVPVLLISGYVTELPEELGGRPHVTFLAKPYTLYSLTSTVRTILDQQAVLSW